MFKETFVDSYLKSPFLWWGVFMFLFTTFSTALVFNLILQAIIIEKLFIPILFIALTIAFIFALYPIRRSLRKLSMKKETKYYGLMYLIMIGLIFVTEGIYFMSDSYVIFGNLSPEVIKDKEFWNYVINVKTLISFVALPFWSAFSFAQIKKKLVLEGYDIKDTLQNNHKFVSIIIIVNFVMGTIAVLAITNWA